MSAGRGGHTAGPTHAQARLAECDHGITDPYFLRLCASALMANMDASDDDLNAADSLVHRAIELENRL